MSWALFAELPLSFSSNRELGDSFVEVNGLTGSQLVFEVSSVNAPITWQIAFRVIFKLVLTDFPGGSILVDSYGRKVPLRRKTLVEVPLNIATPYTIVLAVPYWFENQTVKIWQYTN